MASWHDADFADLERHREANIEWFGTAFAADQYEPDWDTDPGDEEEDES